MSMSGSDIIQGRRSMNDRFGALKERARRIAGISDPREFAKVIEALVDEYADKPLALDAICQALPEKVIEAITYFGCHDNSLAFCLPWEYTVAASMKAAYVRNTEAEYEDDSDLPEGTDRHEAVSTPSRQVRYQEFRTRQEIRELGDEIGGKPKTLMAGRNGDPLRIVPLDDAPELLGEYPQRMSPLADRSLDFRPILLWWSLLKQRDDADQVLRRVIFSRGLAVKPLMFRDLILVAIWQEASFPENVDDIGDDLFEAQELTDDPQVLRNRLFGAVQLASKLHLDQLAAACDELFEELGVQ